MMIRKLIFIYLLLTFVNPLQAGVDQEFGEKKSWWKGSYNQLLSQFGIEKNYALVVGVGDYNDSSFQPLPSEKDAMRIKDYLINEAGFDHVRLITGDKVNLDKIRELMFDHYPGLLSSKDRFLFYWSGHGVTTKDARKQGYLAIQSSQSQAVSSMVSMHDLAQWDRRMKAKQTLYLLDACFSGMAASKAMSVSQDQTIERISRPSSQVLTAGLDNEQTIAISDMNGGVFTRALLDGLRGHADTDKGPFKKDGVVTARELEAYARSRVDHERRRVGWNKSITPVLYNFSRHEGDFFFVSDKRVLKKPEGLIQGSQAEVVATGIRVEPPLQSQQQGNENQNTNRYFRDDRKGIVTDIRTGLMWKKCSEGQRINDCAGVATKFSWKEAVRKFQQVSYGSYNDWRLPSIQELHTLVECGNTVPEKEAFKYSCLGKDPDISTDEYFDRFEELYRGTSKDPTINSVIFPNVKAGYDAWSLTPAANNQARYISFAIGGTYEGNITGDYQDKHSVRLVRKSER